MYMIVTSSEFMFYLKPFVKYLKSQLYKQMQIYWLCTLSINSCTPWAEANKLIIPYPQNISFDKKKCSIKSESVINPIVKIRSVQETRQTMIKFPAQEV